MDEEEKLNERFAFQDQVIPEVKNILKQTMNEDYSIFIDQKNGGIINVGVKSINQKLTELEALFPDKSKLKVNVVKLTEKDLEKIHERVLDKKDVLQSSGIYINDVTTDIINQKVIVGVTNFKKQNQEVLQKEFGEAVEVREAEQSSNSNRANTWNPILGGTKITYSSGGSSYKCSVGFMANDGFSNYVVTAAHCDQGSSYYQGSTSLGGMYHKNESGNTDVGAIGQNSSLTYTGGKIYKTATTTDKYDQTQNADEDVVGESVCMSGASTDTNSVKCGTLESKSFSATFDGISFTKLRKASYTSVGGDSGGTVYGGTKLKGVHKGSSGSSGVYSHLEYCLRDLSSVSNRTFTIIF